MMLDIADALPLILEGAGRRTKLQNTHDAYIVPCSSGFVAQE